MTNAANLAIVISADTAKARTELKTMNGDVQALGKTAETTAKSFALMAIAVVTIDKLKNAIAGSVGAYQEQARAATQLNAVLTSTKGAAGVTADQAIKLSESYQRLTRYQDETILSAENILLTFTSIKSNIFPEATKVVLDMSTALGQDLKSSAIQVGKALNDPIAGFTALRRAGVAFTQSQQDQIKALVESGNKLAAQKIILKELETEFGGSAEAMSPFEKNLDAINDKFHDLQESAGQAIVGGLNLVSQWFIDHAGDIKNFVDKFAGSFDAIKGQVETQLGGVVGAVKDVINLVNGIGDLVSDLAHGRWQQAWQDIKTVALNTVKLMIDQITALLGKLPNLFIDAINAAIRAISSKEILPSLDLGKFLGHTPSVSTPDLSKFQLPKVPTQPFDVANAFTKTLGTLQSAAEKAQPPVKGVASAMDDVSASSSKLGDGLRGLVSSLQSSVSSLFANPTREQAQLQLQLLQSQIDQRHGLNQWQTDLDGSKVFIGTTNGSGNPAQTKQLQDQLQDLQDEHQIYQLRLQLANQTLLSEQGLKQKVDDMIPQVSNFSGIIQKLSDKLGIDLYGGLDDFQKKLADFTKVAFPQVPSDNAAPDDGSHASGLSYVPRDNYRARLHRGEMVLTATEAAALRGGSFSSGDRTNTNNAKTINFYAPVTLQLPPGTNNIGSAFLRI